MLEHIQPRPSQLIGFQHADQSGFVDDFTARGVYQNRIWFQQLKPAGGQQMIGRGRMRAVHGHDIHARQHLIKRVPIGGVHRLFHRGGHAAAVVIMNLQAKGLCAAGDGVTDAAHADNAQPLAGDAVPQHPGGGPAMP